MRRGWERRAHAVPMHALGQDGLTARLLVVLSRRARLGVCALAITGKRVRAIAATLSRGNLDAEAARLAARRAEPALMTLPPV
jgi:hypothetical protein